MPTNPANPRAIDTGARLAWRPLQRSTRLAIIGALLATMFYQLFLMNPAYRGPTWLWLSMVLAEGLTAFHAIGTWWTILAHDDRPEPLAVSVYREQLRSGGVEVPSIDVFITAYGEAPELVRTTMRAARDMDLPHKTWVLDDGDDDELERICAQEGVGYLRREGGQHAKAGNVNAALARTNGEFIVIFDADHVPEPSFLIQVLPHFQDYEVAFVQSPQSYTNHVNLVSTGSAEAQRIFYELVCPGKNYFNAVFCVGTNVIFRRQALDEIGGLHTASNSEDIWTSLELHRRGWRSVFLREALARGLAPDNLLSYFKQQFRWSYGGFEVLIRGKLFRRRTGLTLDQRFQYLLVGTNYLLSLSVLVFMFLPSAYLLFGLSPVRADLHTWLTHYVPFYVLIVLVTWLQCGGFKPAAIVTSIGAAPVHARALLMVLLRRKASWTVTNARAGGLPGVELVLPQIALLLLNAVAIVVGLSAVTDPPAVALAVGWAVLHMLFLGRVIAEALLGPRREAGRIEERKAGARIARARPWRAPATEATEIAM